MKTSVIENDILKEKIHVCEFDNGLQAYVLPKRGYSKKYATYATHYGSIDSEFVVPGDTQSTRVPDGIAHFLEHKLFEQEDGPVLERYAALGASGNAYTSFDHTAYLFSCTERFEESFKLLMKFVQNPYLTDENVEKEKGIIGQEIRMYEDNPNWRVFFNFLDALYVNHPVKKDIAGTIDSISKINKDILYKCYNTFYHPSNMVVCVVGDVEPEWVFEAIRNGQKVMQDRPEIKRIYSHEPININKKMVEQKMQVATPLFLIGFKENTGEIGGNPALHYVGMKILLEMIFGKSSNLYGDLYESGLITSNFDADYTFEGGYSYSTIGGESKSPDQVRDKVIKAIEKINQNGLNEEDFIRVKKMKLGSFIKTFNSVEKIGHEFVANYFKGMNIFDFVNAYTEIDYNKAKEIFGKHFTLGNMALSVVNPNREV